MKVAYVAEVFVGQYNGAKKYDKVADPVWQMIWFALMLFVVTIPLGIYTYNLLLPIKFAALGKVYYQLLIASAPLIAIVAALSAFSIGRGKVKLVTSVVIIANIINIILDLILVLGIKGWVAPMGVAGAAYATVTSNVVQVTILFVAFLLPANNKVYNTRNYSFNKKIFVDCIKIGAPNALGLMLDISAWAVMLLVLAHLRTEYVTVHSIALTIFLFFNFFIDGLQKGITALASNIIGARDYGSLDTLLKSAMKLYFAIIVFLFFPLIVYPEFTVGLFLRDQSTDYITYETIRALRFVWLFFIVDGIFWSYIAMLTAGGDTRFVMMIYSPTVFILLLVPVYIMVKFFNVTPSSLWFIISIYKIIPIICFIYRYKSDKWKKLTL